MLKLLNSKGSTFVTTLVSTLIFMAIAMSILSSMESSFKSTNFNSAKINEMAGMANLKIHLANLATCQKNLKDKTLNSQGEVVLPNILDGSGNALLTAGQEVPQAGLFVTGIKLKYPAGDPAAVTGITPVPAKGFSLPTRIEVSFRKEKISFGSKVYTAALDMPVLVDAGAKVLDCDVTSPVFDLSGLCKQIGGTLDPATNICGFPTDCTQKDPTKLASGKCLKEDLGTLRKTIEDVRTALITPTPSPTATPLPATPEQQQAWAEAETDLIKCFDSGAKTAKPL